MKGILLSACIVISSALMNAQSIADNWYFGLQAGVRFTEEGPVALMDSEMITGEGCATISNSAGELLFYTDGDTVWNRNHLPMPNGTGLLGSTSSTQSAIICPDPSSPHKYFIFTVPSLGDSNGLRYSIVDITMDAGFGDIDTLNKNILITTPVCEKVTAVEKCDKSGYWIITHGFGGNEIYTYSLTASGLSETPIVSYGSAVLDSNQALHSAGYMKASPDGKMIAMCHEGMHLIELFKFNNQSGILSDPIIIDPPFVVNNPAMRPYGLEFSPNSKLLYVSPRLYYQGYVRQFNLAIHDSLYINSSEHILNDSMSSGALQLGPDGRIYGSNLHHLSQIVSPNEIGPLANLIDTAISLNNRWSIVGLPNFIQTIFKNPIPRKTICIGDTVFFNVEDSCAESILWNFGDTGSGSANFSSLDSTIHIYSDSGIFEVKLFVQYASVIDTFTNLITVLEAPSSSNTNIETNICSGDTLTLSANQSRFTDYTWNTGSNSRSISISDSGLYICTISNQCGTAMDSFNVYVVDSMHLQFDNIYTLCPLDSALLFKIEPGHGANWMWWDGDSISLNKYINPADTSAELEVFVTATNACGTVSDTMTVSFLPTPDASLPPDSAHCLDQSFFIFHKSADSVNYLWSDSTSENRFRIDSTMSLWLMAENECGVDRDTFNVVFHPEIKTELGEDTLICNGDSVVLDATWPGASYVWNTGSADSAIVVSEAENYIVTISSPPCQKVEARAVAIIEEDCDSADCKFSIPNVFTPNGDGINDVLRITNTCQNLSFTVFIYNRWGQLVFSSKSSLSGIAWDGFVNGEAASVGTYFVVATHSDGKAQRSAVNLIY